MEPFEFTSNGGGGGALPRRVKRRKPTFYEVINIEREKGGSDRVGKNAAGHAVNGLVYPRRAFS